MLNVAHNTECFANQALAGVQVCSTGIINIIAQVVPAIIHY